ncbi:hypothetical protein ANAEL_00335 [Anaerolineales bacterium]|nr:hypothetical protein ANAEL_00335 [Anaerolineales bacterium]
MKILHKGIALLFKITLLTLLVSVLIPPLYFSWRAAEPLPQPEFKGLTYYQFTQWRKKKYEESIAKYEASHPNVEYTGVGNRMTACYQNEIVIERTFLPFQAFTYTLAALNGVKPDAQHALPESVTLTNFLSKWWDTITYVFWFNTVHASNFGGSLVEYCRFQPNIPTPEEFEALKDKYSLGAVP